MQPGTPYLESWLGGEGHHGLEHAADALRDGRPALGHRLGRGLRAREA